MGSKKAGIKSRREASAYRQGVRSKRGYQNTNTMDPFRGLHGSNEDIYDYDMPFVEDKAVGVKRHSGWSCFVDVGKCYSAKRASCGF